MDTMGLVATDFSLKRALLVAEPLPAALKAEIAAGPPGKHQFSLWHYRGLRGRPGLQLPAR